MTFEPGCRNNWHPPRPRAAGRYRLPAEGLVSEEGKAPVSSPGKVSSPANVKHRTARRRTLVHRLYSGENCGNEWCELVTDEQYNALEG
ncbi:MAG: hypothetical protein ACLS6G_11375 [Christensenellales bacterium]